MKPNEVITMRDQLSEELITEAYLEANKPDDVADWLIGSGWVTALPEDRVDDE